MVQIMYWENGKAETAIIVDTAVESFCEGKMVVGIKRIS